MTADTPDQPNKQGETPPNQRTTNTRDKQDKPEKAGKDAATQPSAPASKTAPSTVADAVGQGDLGAATTQAAEQVQQTISGIADQVRHQATDQLTLQKDRAAGGLEQVAELLRQASQQVREQDQAPVAVSIDGVADRVEQWSDALRAKDVTTLVDETKQLAGRQPVLFVGGALALGFVGVRFFRSTSTPGAANQGPAASHRNGGRDSNPSSTSDPSSVVLHELAELEQLVVPSSDQAASTEPR